MLARGETLFAAGDENAACATLVRGALKVSSFDLDGTEHIVALIHPSGFAGELFAPIAHHQIIALTKCELCVFPRPHYEQALERFPQLGTALLRQSTQELTETRHLLAALNRRMALNRVAAFVLAIARAANRAAAGPARRFDLVISRREIASLLGLTTETVSRQMTKLEQDGVIRRKGLRGIELLDSDQLTALSS